MALVLNGHDHDYQRWAALDGNGNPSPSGVTEIVVGSGGHGLQGQVSTDSRLAASDFTDYGALRLSLGTDGASYQFVSTPGATIDSGSVTCWGGQDTSPPTAATGLTANEISPTQVQLELERIYRQRGRHRL